MAELIIAAGVSTATGMISRSLTSRSPSGGGVATPRGPVMTQSNVDLTLPASRAPGDGTGSPLSVTTEPDGPQLGLFGRRRIGGRVTFAGTSASTGLYYIIIVLAGAPVTAVNGTYIDNTLVTIDGSGNVTTPPWNLSSINVAVYTGAQTAADAVMSAAFPGWTSSQFIGEKQTYVRIRINKAANAAAFAAGVPNFTFDVSGFKAYDPRDVTHNLADPATWAHTTNAALINANYLIHELGAGLPTSMVDWASVAAAANVCGASVTALAGAEIRYAAALHWRADERHEAVLARIGAAHGGGVYLVGDRYRVFSADYRTPDVAIGPDDYEGRGLSWTEYTPLANTANGARGVFSSPLHNFELKDFPPYVDAAALAEDGGTARWLDLQFDAVTSPAQAQRLAKLALNRARRGTAATVELQFTHFDTVAGDVVALTDELAGFDGKQFRVVSEAVSPDFVVRLDLQADAQAFYLFNSATEEKAFSAAGDVNTGTSGGGGVIGSIYGSAGGDAGPLLQGGASAYDQSATAGTVVPGYAIWPSPSTGAVQYRARMSYTKTDRTYRRVNAAWVLQTESATTTVIDNIQTAAGLYSWGLTLADSEVITNANGQPFSRATTNYAINSIDFQTERGGEASGFARIWSGGSLDNLANYATNGPFVMPCACSPYVASGSGSSWTLRTNGVRCDRNILIELWASNTPDPGVGTRVYQLANPGVGGVVNFAVSGTPGQGFYWRTRTIDFLTAQVSPWSSPLLLVYQ